MLQHDRDAIARCCEAAEGLPLAVSRGALALVEGNYAQVLSSDLTTTQLLALAAVAPESGREHVLSDLQRAVLAAEAASCKRARLAAEAEAAGALCCVRRHARRRQGARGLGADYSPHSPLFCVSGEKSNST